MIQLVFSGRVLKIAEKTGSKNGRDWYMVNMTIMGTNRTNEETPLHLTFWGDSATAVLEQVNVGQVVSGTADVARNVQGYGVNIVNPIVDGVVVKKSQPARKITAKSLKASATSPAQVEETPATAESEDIPF